MARVALCPARLPFRGWRTTLEATAAEVLSAADWHARAAAHAGARRRASSPRTWPAGATAQAHPVHDFLFTYYSQRPAQLRRWHPGFGVALADAEERAAWKGYAVDRLDRLGVARASSPRRRPWCPRRSRCCSATAARPANFGCFGLHEWAMVHRLSEDTTRHPDWPLRLGPAGTDRGGGVAPGRLLALRRVPLLHPVGPAAQRAPARSRTTGRRTSSRPACTPTWTSTSTPSG